MIGVVAAVLVMIWLLLSNQQINVPQWVSIFLLISAFIAGSKFFRAGRDARSAKEVNLPSFTISVESAQQ